MERDGERKGRTARDLVSRKRGEGGGRERKKQTENINKNKQISNWVCLLKIIGMRQRLFTALLLYEHSFTFEV